MRDPPANAAEGGAEGFTRLCSRVPAGDSDAELEQRLHPVVLGPAGVPTYQVGQPMATHWVVEALQQLD